MEAGQDKPLRGKVALVTGAGGGIGKAIAKHLAARGARVVTNDLVLDRAKKVVDEIRKEGGESFPVKADVAEVEEVSSMVETIAEKYGNIDILVNNAGVLRPTKIEDIKEEEWDLVIDANLKGTFNCSKAVLPSMKKEAVAK